MVRGILINEPNAVSEGEDIHIALNEISDWMFGCRESVERDGRDGLSNRLVATRDETLLLLVPPQAKPPKAVGNNERQAHRKETPRLRLPAKCFV